MSLRDERADSGQPVDEGVSEVLKELTETFGFTFVPTPGGATSAHLIGGQAVGQTEDYVLLAGFYLDDLGTLVMVDCYTSGTPSPDLTAKFFSVCASVPYDESDPDKASEWVASTLAEGVPGELVIGSATFELQYGLSRTNTARLIIRRN